MADKKLGNPGCVTTAECAQISGSINKELGTIKRALVGDDMRGGIVKDVADIKSNLRNSTGLGRKERAMIYTSIISVAGLIIIELIKFWATVC